MAKVSFEKAMDQLAQIVQDMESGNLTLEQSLKKFEEGIKLSTYCTQKLEETEKKISLLMSRTDGSVIEKPFEGNESIPIDLKNESS